MPRHSQTGFSTIRKERCHVVQFCGNTSRGFPRRKSAPTWSVNARLRRRTPRSKRNVPRWRITHWIVSSSVPNKAMSLSSNGWRSAASSACRGSALSSRLPQRGLGDDLCGASAALKSPDSRCCRAWDAVSVCSWSLAVWLRSSLRADLSVNEGGDGGSGFGIAGVEVGADDVPGCTVLQVVEAAAARARWRGKRRQDACLHQRDVGKCLDLSVADVARLGG